MLAEKSRSKDSFMDYSDGVKAVGSQESMLIIQECPDIESGSDLLLKGASE